MGGTKLQLAWLLADVEHLQRITAMQAHTLASFADRLRALSSSDAATPEVPLSIREGADIAPPLVRLLTPEERAAKQAEYMANEPARRAAEVERRERIRGKAHVYFIQQGDSGAIKIGCSKNPTQRLQGLQTGHSEALRLLTCAVGSQAQERALHDRFAHLRVSGEWFRPAEDLLAYIRLVNDRRAL